MAAPHAVLCRHFHDKAMNPFSAVGWDRSCWHEGLPEQGTAAQALVLGILHACYRPCDA